MLAAIEAVREGKCVVVTDDEGRENEGDLVFAAEKVRAVGCCFPVLFSDNVYNKESMLQRFVSFLAVLKLVLTQLGISRQLFQTWISHEYDPGFV